MTPYAQGRLAHINGHDYNSNPYDPITHPIAAREWRSGWLEAETAERDAKQHPRKIGRAAYERGTHFEDNPYNPITEANAHRAWQSGWCAAQLDQERTQP